jgi:hypothetical protein
MMPMALLRVEVVQVRVASLQQKCAEAAEITQVAINGKACLAPLTLNPEVAINGKARLVLDR